MPKKRGKWTSKKWKNSRGRCILEISKCFKHNAYLCDDCHPTDSNGYLQSVPKYIADTSQPCDWAGKKSSIRDHVKRYHNIQREFGLYWRSTTSKGSQESQIVDDVVRMETQMFGMVLPLPRSESSDAERGSKVETSNENESKMRNKVISQRIQAKRAAKAQEILRQNKAREERLQRRRKVIDEIEKTRILKPPNTMVKTCDKRKYKASAESIRKIKETARLKRERKLKRTQKMREVLRQNLRKLRERRMQRKINSEKEVPECHPGYSLRSSQSAKE